MLILTSAALAAAAPAAQSAPPAHVHGSPTSQAQAGHEQMKDCCKCCEEMMAKMHDGHASEHNDHQKN